MDCTWILSILLLFLIEWDAVVCKAPGPSSFRNIQEVLNKICLDNPDIEGCKNGMQRPKSPGFSSFIDVQDFLNNLCLNPDNEGCKNGMQKPKSPGFSSFIGVQDFLNNLCLINPDNEGCKFQNGMQQSESPEFGSFENIQDFLNNLCLLDPTNEGCGSGAIDRGTAVSTTRPDATQPTLGPSGCLPDEKRCPQLTTKCVPQEIDCNLLNAGTTCSIPQNNGVETQVLICGDDDKPIEAKCCITMDTKQQKQRAVIEFFTQEGYTAANIHKRLRNVYGEAAIDKSNVQRWMNKFKEGKTSVEDKPYRGRPSTAVTQENQNRVDNRVHTDQRNTVREIVEELGCGHSAVEQILYNLGYKKACAKWNPHQLTADLKKQRLDLCLELLAPFGCKLCDWDM